MAAKSPQKANLFRRSLIFGYMVNFEHDGRSTGGFIYWEPDQSILGLSVFDGMARIYEKNLDKQERKKLLLNPADTMLEVKMPTKYPFQFDFRWNNAMKEKTIQVSKIGDSVAQLSHSDQIIELLRIVDEKEIAKRQEKQLTLYMREIKELSALVSEVTGTGGSKKSNTAKRPVSQPMFGRRRPQTDPAAGPSTKVPKQEQDSPEEYD